MIAAIGGFAMGGGLELALGCHYRVAAPKSQLGLPEVKLGLLPGSGGTQRLPRVVPMAEAVKMMTTGSSMAAEKAKERGLVDEIVTGDLLEGALAFAKKLVAEGKGPRRIRDMKVKLDGDPKAFFDAARAEVAKASRGFPAPLEIVACVEAAVNLPFDEGRRRSAAALRCWSRATNRRRCATCSSPSARPPRSPTCPRTRPVRAIKTAAVIGAGTMGGGITMSLVNAGIPVTMIEMKQEALDRGLATIKKNYASTVSKGRLKQEEMDKRVALITPSLSMDGVKDADIVIEAVFERMDVKQDIFRKLDALAKPGAILASNTSTLDVNAIADVTKRPQDVIGTHFFSPANVMRLLEVVRGAKTAKDVLATTMKLGKTIKKVPVVSGVCDGFIGNRMIEKYGQQSLFLLDEGCSPAQVDAAAQKWGMAMGPLTMGDMAGLDIGWEIRKRRAQERPNMVYSKIGDRICEQGRYGQKTGKGWYLYEAGGGANARKPIPRSRRRQDHRGLPQGNRRQTEADFRRGDRRAADLRAGERGRVHPGGRHRAEGFRHRHGVPHRLRLPGLPRRADVLRQHGRPAEGGGSDQGIPERLQGRRMEARAAARAAGEGRQEFHRLRRSQEMNLSELTRRAQ